MTAAVYLNAMGVLCALGHGEAAVREQLFASARPQGVAPTDRYTPGRVLHLGCLPSEGGLPSLAHVPLRQRSRNNALLAAALAEIRPQVDAAIGRYGPQRVAVVLGTSTGGVEEGERAARRLLAQGDFPPEYDYAQQEMGNCAAFVAAELGVFGPAHAVSTACSSGAKAMASGARLLRAGIVDAVVAGGVDALCAFTIAGFSALESVTADRCNPLSVNREGINIGEGAALFLMTREAGPVRLAGWGETSDAHHMSAPEPGGRGAIDAMRLSLQRAGLAAGAVDYVNLHGTATPHNDAMESLAIAEVESADARTSRDVEAAISWCSLVDNPRGWLPPHWWDGERDPALPALRVVPPGESLGRSPEYVLSNSFAFGGSNASLLFARG